ncbi:MAG: hypothetical protein IKR34_04925 [Candidatus Gastranaerophilales bacterium]|nr:hypothetical protein [Candidatus Gastranaerophilales bacterium]
MNIPSILGFSFNPKTNINRNLTNKFNLFSNLKLNQLNADTVSFTSNKNKSEDEEYYREIAKKVNQSLKEGDDLTAFETLGYDIDLDWVSEKITIKGNYIPFFIYNSKNGITVKPYAEFGIDENKLLQDVEAVEGMRVYYPLESEENDRIKINSNSRSCKENEFDILKALLQARAPRVEEALNEGDSETALNLLGFETSSNKAGEITIEGDYSDTLLTKDFAGESVSLRDIGIDENKLLKNVTKIKGNASFSDESDFEPKQYIKIDGTCNNHDIARKLVLQNRDFIDKVSSIKDSISAGDNYAALKKLGFNPKKANDGSITIDCSYAPILRDNRFIHMKQGPLKFSFKTLGIDDKNLFENVSAINSNVDLEDSNIDHLEDIAIKTNLKLTGSKVKVLGKNVLVGGLVYHRGIDAEQLFTNFVNYDRQISTDERVKDKILHGLVTNRIVNKYLKSHEGKYYFYPNSEDCEFMDTLSQNRDTVLTGDEICKETGMSTNEFMDLINKYGINPYCMNRLPYYIHLDELLFDINDRRSGKSLNDAIDIRNSTIIDADGHSTGALEKDVNRKLRKIEHFGKYGAYSMNVPTKVLEEYGYGRKQDILAACSIMRYQYDVCNYVLNNDDYNVHSHIMMDILDTARNSNPEILKINDLSKLLSERDYKKLLAAILNGEVDAIPYDVLRWTLKGNYFINLFSEKNYEFFKSINDL